MSHEISSYNIIKLRIAFAHLTLPSMCLSRSAYGDHSRLLKTFIYIFGIRELGEDIHRRGVYAGQRSATRNTRQSGRSQCKGEGNRRQGRDSVFYLNDVKGEPPRLESGRVAAFNVYQPLSIFIVLLFIPSPLLLVFARLVRDLCTFPLTPSDGTSGEQRFKFAYLYE